MNDLSNREQAVELLQKLGLKEYEAKSLVALSRLPQGTAKDVSEISQVPRTRVYDAIRVLETKGLVEIQHSNPQRFRAVSIDEAADTLRAEYESLAESFRETVRGIEPAALDDDDEATHEVWTLSGDAAITNRTTQLIGDAEREVVLVIGHREVFTGDLADALTSAQEQGVGVVVGTIAEDLREVVEAELPAASVFVSGLEWLSSAAPGRDETEISRLLLVDGSTILVSSYRPDPANGRTHEQAVFGRGFDNGLVVITRRLMETGLLPANDAGAG